MFEFVLLINALWFVLGFHLFALRSKIFAKTLVPREHRNSPIFEMFVQSGKFLGGFNLAFCVLNMLVLLNSSVFPEANQRIILCVVFALAHGSQFLPNAFIALENRKGKGVWEVKGLMRFILIVDFVLMVANLSVVGMYS